MRTTVNHSLPQFSFLPSTFIHSRRKNIFQAKEHTISESFSLHDDAEGFFLVAFALLPLPLPENNKWLKIKEIV